MLWWFWWVGGLAVDVAAGCSGWAAERWFGGEWRVLARWSGGPGAGCDWCGGVCCVSDALVIIASVRGGWECPGKPGGLEDERERRGKRERQAKVGGGRFIGNLGGPELLADLERVQLFGRRNSSWAGCGLQVRAQAQAQAHRTTWHLAPTLAPALYTGHFPVRATGDGQPADQPWKSPSCPRHPRPQNLPSSSGEHQARPPSPVPRPLRLPTPGHRLRSSILSPARLPGLIALSNPTLPNRPALLSPTAHRQTMHVFCCCSRRRLCCARYTALLCPCTGLRSLREFGSERPPFLPSEFGSKSNAQKVRETLRVRAPAPPVVNRLRLRAPLPAPAPATAPSSASASASVELSFHLCQQHAPSPTPTSCSKPSHPAPPVVLQHLHSFLHTVMTFKLSISCAPILPRG